MSRVTFIGIGSRSFTKPDEKGTPHFCPGCKNIYLAPKGKETFGCKRCIVVDVLDAMIAKNRREAKAAKKKEQAERAAKLNPAWKH